MRNASVITTVLFAIILGIIVIIVGFLLVNNLYKAGQEPASDLKNLTNKTKNISEASDRLFGK